MFPRLSLVARCALGLFSLSLMLQAQEEKRPCWLRDAASPSASTTFLLCEQGGLWITSDSGATWKPLATGSTEKHRAFVWLDAKRALAVGNNGTILATEDAAKTWTARTSPVKDHLMDIAFVGEEGWIAGYHGIILHSIDGGKSWTEQTTPTTMTLECITFMDKMHGIAAGWSGTIIRTNDGGKKWEIVKAPSATWTLSTVYFRDLKDGWILGFGGQLLHSTDGGGTWTSVKSPVNASLNGISFDEAGRGWVTYDEGFLLSEDKGATWQVVNPGGRYFLGRLLNVNKGLWAVGQSVILQQSGAGKEWVKNPNLVANSVVAGTASKSAK